MLQGSARPRVVLVPGHAGNPVVHDDGNDVAAVVCHIDQRRDGAVEEGRITDDRHMAFLIAGDGCAVRHAHAGAHATDCMQRVQWLHHTQGVTANIAVNRHA